MIEEGLVKLIKASVPGNGGYFAAVPEGTTLPVWSYLFVSDIPSLVLSSVEGLTEARVQIDCYGNDPSQAINLAQAIHTLLHGYSGVLTDGDATRVQECRRLNRIDFFDDVSRSFRRMLDFRLYYSAK